MLYLIPLITFSIVFSDSPSSSSLILLFQLFCYWCCLSHFVNVIYLRKGKRESCIPWFTHQMPALLGLGRGWKWESGTQSSYLDSRDLVPWHLLLPLRIQINRNIESGVELVLAPRHSDRWYPSQYQYNQRLINILFILFDAYSWRISLLYIPLKFIEFPRNNYFEIFTKQLKLSIQLFQGWSLVLIDWVKSWSSSRFNTIGVRHHLHNEGLVTVISLNLWLCF